MEVRLGVEGVNVEELGLYLSVSLKEDDLMEAGIARYCPTRKSNRGRPPSITGSVLEEKKEKRFMSWKPASEQPDEVATRRMLTEALRVVLTFIMKNHVHKFDGTVRKQAKGGAIGLELTGVLAQMFMVWWDREFKARVEGLGIPLYMYQRYVDNINVIVGAVEPGAKIAGGMLTIDKKSKAQDSHRNKDEICMELLKEVGNRIHKSIQIEVDYLSKHEDNLMPILDLKVWIARKIVIMNGQDCTVNVVLHEFYTKEVSSKMMLSSRSALPMKVKRTVLTQEVLRVLLNCNPEIPWEQMVGHVNNMMRRMQYSGYSKGFRYEIVQSALHACKKIQELDQTGVKLMYRP